MLMTPSKAETSVHSCHCPGDMAVRMREILARPWVGVRVCHLLLLFFKVKKVCIQAKWLIRPELIPILEIERLGVFLLSTGWDASPSQGYPAALNSSVPIHTPGWREAL